MDAISGSGVEHDPWGEIEVARRVEQAGSSDDEGGLQDTMA